MSMKISSRFTGRLLIGFGLLLILGMILTEILPFNQFGDRAPLIIAIMVLGGIVSIAIGISVLYLHHNYAKRKKVIVVLSICCGFIFLFSVLSKFLHAPGASIEMVVSILFFSFSATPLIIKNRYEKRKIVLSQKLLLVSIIDLFSVVFILLSALSKFLHWPGATYMFVVGVSGILFSVFNWNQSFKKEVGLRTEAENKLKLAFKELEEKHFIIEEKNKEIFDSINYARRIQKALLAGDDVLKNNLANHFVLFKPKDIVSGDFYWATSVNVESGIKNDKLTERQPELVSGSQQITNNKELFYFAVCDSTGHGVPGAFMSLLNISFLNEAVNEKGIKQPNKVFDFVRQRLIDNISKDGQKDGFDGILVCIDKANKKVSYAAANNAPVLVRDNVITELEADRMPVGYGERRESFTLFELDYKPGDRLYLYTDGYADQFGGPKGKKFKYKQLNDLLLSIFETDQHEQKKQLDLAIENWKGSLEQVDDILVAGIQFD